MTSLLDGRFDAVKRRRRFMPVTSSDYGAAWGNRTPDLFITSESLYRLS